MRPPSFGPLSLSKLILRFAGSSTLATLARGSRRPRTPRSEARSTRFPQPGLQGQRNREAVENRRALWSSSCSSDDGPPRRDPVHARRLPRSARLDHRVRSVLLDLSPSLTDSLDFFLLANRRYVKPNEVSSISSAAGAWHVDHSAELQPPGITFFFALTTPPVRLLFLLTNYPPKPTFTSSRRPSIALSHSSFVSDVGRQAETPCSSIKPRLTRG